MAYSDPLKQSIIVPYALPPVDPDGRAEAYRTHSLRQRFFRRESGLFQAGESELRRLAHTHLAIGETLDNTLKRGFVGLRKGQLEIHEALIDQTDVMRKGLDRVEFATYRGFERTNETLAEGLTEIEEQLVTTRDRLADGIDGLKSSFDMGMANVVNQFELQREELRAGLDQLTDMLANQQKGRAREHYLDGKTAYEQYLDHPDEPQLLTDARDYLQKSLEIFRGNPYAHLYLGHLYREPAAYYDLKKAQHHYRQCATYAKGTQNRALVALGFFFTAWMAYVRGNVVQAIELGEESIKFDPDHLPEAWYNLAKYHAHRRNASEALRYLDVAVKQHDPAYTVKANLDPDFSPIQEELDAYFVDLREEAARAWRKELRRVGTRDEEVTL